MNVSAPGEGMTSDYRCEECTSDGLAWDETTCALEGMTGIANERNVSLMKARELTRQLQNHFEKSTTPMWIAVQNRGEDDPDQYWIGLAIGLGEPLKSAGAVPGTGGAPGPSLELAPCTP